MAAQKESRASIDDLIPDQKNANKGTEYGGALLEKSLRELGAGRSILLDKHNNIIAGNKTTETAAAIGMNNVRIIETDGSEIIAVKRTDLDIDSAQGRQLALADNQVGRVNLDFDMDVIGELGDEFNFEVKDWGLDVLDTPKVKKEKEVEELPTEHKCPNCGYAY